MQSEGVRSGSDRENLQPLPSSSNDISVVKEMNENLEGLSSFSESAKAAAHKSIHNYACILIRTAIVNKERVRGDSVSEANVKEATFALNKHESGGLEKVAGILGGIFLGTAFSSLASMIQSSHFTNNGCILAVATGTVGAFLITLDLPARLRSS